MEKHLIFIVLVILLFILIFVEKENLKNISKYREYRLGDLVKGYFTRTVDRKKYLKLSKNISGHNSFKIY